jgi:hypothetical protein
MLVQHLGLCGPGGTCYRAGWLPCRLAPQCAWLEVLGFLPHLDQLLHLSHIVQTTEP